MKNQVTLGLTPYTTMENCSNNREVLSVNYNSGDMRGDYVRILLEDKYGSHSLELSPEEAVESGFINPNALKNYFKKHSNTRL